jgi:hypothetical protein
MKLTAGAANLLVAAGDRSDRLKRRTAALDLRAAMSPDGKALKDLLRLLER